MPFAHSDDDGYEELFTDHFWGLVRLATPLGADDVEDVVQDAFVRLHRKRRTLRDPDAVLAYLRSSVCNASRSPLRHPPERAQDVASLIARVTT